MDALRLAFDLRCAQTHAFATWTQRLGDWWPRAHTVTGEPEAAIVLEPGVGGRIFERTAAGQEHDWGEITLWDPPRRLGYLWHIRRDRAAATDVLLTFVATGARTTRLEITHTGWERLGTEGAAWRERNRGGWDGLLPHFAAACA